MKCEICRNTFSTCTYRYLECNISSRKQSYLSVNKGQEPMRKHVKMQFAGERTPQSLTYSYIHIIHDMQDKGRVRYNFIPVKLEGN